MYSMEIERTNSVVFWGGGAVLLWYSSGVVVAGASGHVVSPE